MKDLTVVIWPVSFHKGIILNKYLYLITVFEVLSNFKKLISTLFSHYIFFKLQSQVITIIVYPLLNVDFITGIPQLAKSNMTLNRISLSY